MDVDGLKWTITRKFVLKYLKNFGYNMRHMDNYIEEECRALVQLRVDGGGRPVLVNTMFHVSVVNIMWRLVAVTKEDIHVVCLDLLEAGMETVSNTAVFMLLHLVRNEEVQRKLQKEIDEVIGHARTPTVIDRTRMMYTEAVILETLRISSVAAVGIPHMALKSERLGNYIIPKGTFLLLAMHDLHNGNHWKDPDAFRPERKRRCIGEGMARSELFMFLTHLLQRFNMRIPEEDPLPSTEPIDGLTLSAKPFRVIFEPRLLGG
ncbi:Cytochrome P450 [Operophtera brumata]|uniref:Cytochrome P450 n=1 Tax=Operophtera brumata TaxID=104452 RepID=A0A0L7LD03_OPEBR|nr:Cytochrome P450 [Operophtera brumata]